MGIVALCIIYIQKNKSSGDLRITLQNLGLTTAEVFRSPTLNPWLRRGLLSSFQVSLNVTQSLAQCSARTRCLKKGLLIGRRGKTTGRKTDQERTTSSGTAHPRSPQEEAKCSGWPEDTRCRQRAPWGLSPFYFCWYRKKQAWKPVLATAFDCKNIASSACLLMRWNRWTHNLLNRGVLWIIIPPVILA